MNNQRYVIHETIGQGGMGSVFRADDRLTGQAIALKRVQVSPTSLEFNSKSVDANAYVSLASEFRILASLRHPNIIPVLDYGFDEERRPFLTMHLLENARTILQAAAGKSLTQQVNLILQLLQAVAYLHRQNIIHRDLKPSNVLVVDDHVYVLDFGLAVVASAAVGTAGTPAYMAPEIIASGQAVPQSDLYAVGVLLYQIITDHLPYDPDLSSILQKTPKFSRLGNHPLRFTLERLLRKDPAERQPTAQDLIFDLCSVMELTLPEEDHSLRDSYLRAATFVGREAEIDRLTEALAEAKTGAGSLWLIGGESGVGKSRLLEELRIRALVEGALVVRSEALAGSPDHLWANALPPLLLTGQIDDVQAAALTYLIPHIGKLLGRDLPGAPSADVARDQLEPIILDVLRQQSWLLLLLEDLHVAGQNLGLLQAIARQIGDLPVLIVASYRSEEAPGLLYKLPYSHTLSLARLNENEIERLAQAMIGQSAQQADVLQLLSKETEGNAFFLVEVVRTLAEEAGSLDQIGLISLPESVLAGSVVELVRRRLSRVPDWAQPMLKVAAVAGRVVDERVLSAFGQAGIQFDHWLTACVNAAVLEFIDQRWRFAHDKLRETILLDLSEAESAELRGRVAQALERAQSEAEIVAAKPQPAKSSTRGSGGASGGPRLMFSLQADVFPAGRGSFRF